MKFSDSVKAVQIRTYQLALEKLEDRLTPGETMGAALSSFVCPYLAFLGADMLRPDAPTPVVNSAVVADAAPQAPAAHASAAPAAPVATPVDTSDSAAVTATPVKEAVANPPMDDSADIQSTPLTPSASDAAMTPDPANDALTADPSTLDASNQADVTVHLPTAQNDAGTLLNGNGLLGASGSGLVITPSAPAAGTVAASAATTNATALEAASAAAAASAAPSGTSSPMLAGVHPTAAPGNRPLSTTSTAPPYTPAQIKQAYGFNLVSNQGSGQTIYIVDAYNDPDISSDLSAFDSEFGLPSANLTVHKMSSFISNSRSWSLEESLDVEWAHAIAPQANITLVEATSNSNSALYGAVSWATTNGAHVVSMSWGGSDSSGESSYDSYFNHSGVSYVAASGDAKVVEYPSASPYVLSVGGTSLTLNSSGGYGSESAWSSAGGGASAYEAEPTYQKNFGISLSGRGTPDVSYNANPNDGYYVADSYYERGYQWWEVGGTSAAAPQWAALIALADQSLSTPLSTSSLTSRIEYSAAANSTLYALNYHDITTGSNGHNAGPGYDLATGIGTPQANNLVGWLILNN